MMRSVFSYVAAVVLFLTLSGCSKERQVFCDLTLRLVQPDDLQAVTVRTDNTLPGNVLRNYNTGQNYDFPLFVNGAANLRVLKGVYLIAFDGVATLSDGSVRTFRFSGYNAPDKAVSILDDVQTVELEVRAL